MPGWDGLEVLRRITADLGTICADRIKPAQDLPPFTLITTPPRSSAAPSSFSASPTASGTCSQASIRSPRVSAGSLRALGLIRGTSD
jgi:hypothetical protein